MSPTNKIKTCFFSPRTHGIDLPNRYLLPVEVAIYCGDLTTESKLDEFDNAIRLLERVDALLELAIAGNHNSTLDTPMFKIKVAKANEPLDPSLVRGVYGDYGEARRIFDNSSHLAGRIILVILFCRMDHH